MNIDGLTFWHYLKLLILTTRRANIFSAIRTSLHKKGLILMLSMIWMLDNIKTTFILRITWSRFRLKLWRVDHRIIYDQAIIFLMLLLTLLIFRMTTSFIEIWVELVFIGDSFQIDIQVGTTILKLAFNLQMILTWLYVTLASSLLSTWYHWVNIWNSSRRHWFKELRLVGFKFHGKNLWREVQLGLSSFSVAINFFSDGLLLNIYLNCTTFRWSTDKVNLIILGMA